MTAPTSSSLGRPSVDLVDASATCDRIEAVRKSDLRPGDWVLVSTRNSQYLIGRRNDGQLVVSGGWFDVHGQSPVVVDVVGCTFGGHAIHTKLLAAPGLYLEFEGGVKTTRIQSVRHYQGPIDGPVS